MKRAPVFECSNKLLVVSSANHDIHDQKHHKSILWIKAKTMI